MSSPAEWKASESLSSPNDGQTIRTEYRKSWIERKLAPSKVTARYPIKGKPLLFATCAFGSLGDALFGYNSGSLILFGIFAKDSY